LSYQYNCPALDKQPPLTLILTQRRALGESTDSIVATSRLAGGTEAPDV
jgi:hypothetical protein